MFWKNTMNCFSHLSDHIMVRNYYFFVFHSRKVRQAFGILQAQFQMNQLS